MKCVPNIRVFWHDSMPASFHRRVVISATHHDADCVGPDATSIYDIRSTPYDVDCVDLDDTSIFPTEPHGASDPDATATIDIRGEDWDDLDTTAICLRPLSPGALTRRQLITEARQDIVSLRDALASGWDIGLELAYTERRLAALCAF